MVVVGNKGDKRAREGRLEARANMFIYYCYFYYDDDDDDDATPPQQAHGGQSIALGTQVSPCSVGSRDQSSGLCRKHFYLLNISLD